MWLLGSVEPTIGFEPMAPAAEEGKIYPVKEVKPPQIPEDLNMANKSGKVERQLILFLQFPMSKVKSHDTLVSVCLPSLNSGMGWVMLFSRCGSNAASPICIMLCADHGPCVSGAHNTMVTTRAGKDLVSSLVAGLLTIGARFGGAIDDVARYFNEGYDKGLSPYEFLENMNKKGIRMPGIGHRFTAQRLYAFNEDQSFALEYFLLNGTLKHISGELWRRSTVSPAADSTEKKEKLWPIRERTSNWNRSRNNVLVRRSLGARPLRDHR